jgi:archaeal flagellin FlaB
VEDILLPLKKLNHDINADIGIGALIIFIAMIMVAGVTASVMIQTMTSLQQQAIKTSEETVKEISSGVKVTHISGYINNSKISQLAVFINPMTASDDIDLTYTMISLTDSSSKVILNYTNRCYSRIVDNGLFGTINASNLSASKYGLIVIRDIDGSCTITSPIINEEDLVVLLVNTSKCFSGIGTRIDVSGEVYPEYGVRGIIGFTTPSSYINKIIDLQP